MWDIRVCVGCLATDVRMYSMGAGGQLQTYQQLVGVKNDIHFNDMPDKLCWECAALVNKFNTFKHRCERSHLLLRDIYTQHQEISEDIVEKLDRSELGLSSFLSVHTVHVCSVKTQAPRKQKPKEACTHATLKMKHEAEHQDLPDPFVKTENDIDAEDDIEIKYDVSHHNTMHENDELKNNMIAVTPLQRIGRDNLQSSLTQNRSDHAKTDEISNINAENDKFLQIFEKCNLTRSIKSDNQSAVPSDRKNDYKKGIANNDPKIDLKDVSDIKNTSRGVKKVLKSKRRPKKYNIHKEPDGAAKNVKNKNSVRKGRIKCEVIDNVTIVNLTQEQMMQIINDRQHTDKYKKMPIKCTLCYRGYRDEKAYKNHMVLHNPGTGPMECDICKYRTGSRRSMYMHINGCHLRQYVCKICSVVNCNRSEARLHSMRHAGVTYQCHICGKEFRKKTNRLDHIRSVHQSDHVCFICSETFVSKKGLDCHTRIMHLSNRDGAPKAPTVQGSECFFCSTCDVHFVTERARTRHILLSKHHKRDRTEIPNGCTTCGETFTTAHELKEHRRAEKIKYGKGLSLGEPKPCTECGELMLGVRDYRAHFQLKHGGEPSLPEQAYTQMCEVCGKRFQCSKSFAVHRHMHKVDGEYECEICSKIFFAPYSLKHHLLTHSDERPQKCVICGKAFKTSANLIKHSKSHTGKKPYECTICRKTFTQSTGRNLHMRNIHHKEPIINLAYKSTMLRSKKINSSRSGSHKIARKTIIV